MTDRLTNLIQGLAAKRVGSSWMARCPAHDDHIPSLSIREIGGKILVHCHAGCTQTAVLTALKTAGAWSTERGMSPELSLTLRQRIERTYDYTDECGKLLYQTVRLHSPKNFLFRYPNPQRCGDWKWRKHPKQVLYRLREVLEAPIVFVVEGGKDVETMRWYCFVATTNAGGAKVPWLDSYTEALRGREVIIIGDADLPGRQRAERINTRRAVAMSFKSSFISAQPALNAITKAERGRRGSAADPR